MKPYYQDENVTLYQGDALEVMGSLDSATVHLVATDPPYFRVVDAEWDDQWGPDQRAFLEWISTLIGLYDKKLVDRGTLAIFCSPDLSAGVEFEVRKHMAVLNHIVWRKPDPGRLGQMNKESLRRFFPLSERIIIAEKDRNPDGDLFRFRDHVNHSVARDVYADVREMLVKFRDAAKLSNKEVDLALGTSGMAGHYFGASQWCLPTEEAWATISNLMQSRGVEPPEYEHIRQEFDSRRREFDSRRREFDSRRHNAWEFFGDVWTFPTVIPSRRLGNHPTQKPEPLMEHLIGTLSRPGDTILDTFAGTGTTLIAARNLGRKAIGVELDERYCEVIARRLSQDILNFGDTA